MNARNWVLSGAVLALMASLASQPALAEVRIETSVRGLDLRVVATSRGPWTPIGASGKNVINPAGDLLGDSAPGTAGGPGAAVAAWLRPLDGTLQVAVASQDGSVRHVARPAPTAFGTPVVRRVGDAWSVTWMTHGPEQGIEVLGVTDEGATSDPLAVGDGLLAGVLVTDEVLHVVTLAEPAGSLDVTSIAFVVLPGHPVDIPLLRPVAHQQLALPGDADVMTGIAGWRDCSVVQRDGTSVAVAWWSLGRGAVAALTVDEQGVRDDLRVHRGLGFLPPGCAGTSVRD